MTTVIACAPAGTNGGCACRSVVIADCGAFDCDFCPAAGDSMSGIE
jgi:hypothetical protein